MSIRRATWAGGLAALCLASTAAAVPFEVTVERLLLDPFNPEDEQLTFSGAGRVEIDPAGTGLAAIEDLALSLQTLADVDGADAVLTFSVDEGDLAFVDGLDGPPAPDLAGVVIGLGTGAIEAEGGGASFLPVGGPAALVLDFAAGVASAFCVGEQEGGVQCIRGGGSSSGLEGGLTAAVIPLPASLPLALTALGGLAAWRRLRRG